MDKKSPIRRAKRQSKVLEDNFWDCSVCTYRNTAEAFKCLMCDVRKGENFSSILLCSTKISFFEINSIEILYVYILSFQIF
jgi:hypothetical protein